MIKKLILAAMLCMAAISFSSCSGGLNLPEPVCEYGTTICNTLSYLCDLQAQGKLTPEQELALQHKLSAVCSDLTGLKIEIANSLQSK